MPYPLGKRRGANYLTLREFQASDRLAEAANVIGQAPGALQLRFLQTLAEVATEHNSTIIFPLPIDLIQPFFGRTEGGEQGSAS